jgi:hypothetical protein
MHDPLCVEADLQALRPENEETPAICHLDPLCICDLINRARIDERDKVLYRIFNTAPVLPPWTVNTVVAVVSAIRGEASDGL